MLLLERGHCAHLSALLPVRRLIPGNRAFGLPKTRSLIRFLGVISRTSIQKKGGTYGQNNCLHFVASNTASPTATFVRLSGEAEANSATQLFDSTDTTRSWVNFSPFFTTVSLELVPTPASLPRLTVKALASWLIERILPSNGNVALVFPLLAASRN